MGQFDFTSELTPIKLDDHSARHENEGADEISLTGLSGDPADTINESLLTTQDDIIVRGVSIAERLNITAQTLVGRLTGGNISAVAIGLSDNNIPQIDGTTNVPTNLDYAKWTASGLEGKSYQGLVNDISGVIKGTDVEVSELSAADYDDVQDYINFFGDRTLLSGGTISDSGSGEIDIGSCTAWCKVSDSDTAVGKFLNYAGKINQALNNNSVNVIYLDYNQGGTAVPGIVVATSFGTYGFQQDHILIGAVYRQDNTLHIFQSSNLGIGGVNRDFMHQVEHHGAHRASGMITTATNPGSDLAISVSTGVLYAGLNRHTTTADGTSFSYWYTPGDSGSSWIEETSQSALVHYYNDIDDSSGGTPGKFALTVNRYGVHWVYMDYDGVHIHVVYGQGDYKANEAEESSVPSVLPPIVTGYCVLIAKIISQQGTDDMVITYPWTTVFTSSLATDHNLLANLAVGDVHTQYILADGTRAFTGNITGSGAAYRYLLHALDTQGVGLCGGTLVAGKGALIQATGVDSAATGAIYMYTPNAAENAWILRLTLSGDIDTAVAAWGNITHTGIVTSDIDINGGTIDGVTITSPNLNEAVALTATATELNLLDLAGMTAGDVLIATGAATVAWALITKLGTVTSGTLSTGAVLADVTMTLGSDADGDIYYRSSNKLSRIAKGTEGQVLAMGASNPAWADPINTTSDWKGNFNWDTSVNTTDETDISALFSTNLALTTRRKYSVKLDLTTVEADGSFVSCYIRVKEKVDGSNYRAIDMKLIEKADIAAAAEPGIIIDIPATSENIQITMQMTTATAGDCTIYYAVVKEHLE